MSSAQTESRKINYAGHDFWIALDEVDTRCIFYITGAAHANVTLHFLATGTVTNLTLPANGILRYTLAIAEGIAISNPLIETVDKKSLHITADKDIVVNLINMGGANDDGMLLFPSDKQQQATDYYFNGAFMTTRQGGNYCIVSRCDSTLLEIIPSQPTALHAQGIPFTVRLNKGESYKIVPGTAVADLSGTKVKVKYALCCNPVNIFITHRSNYMLWPFPPQVPSNVCCADRLLEQVLPVDVWDTIYPVVPFSNNPYNVLKIVSAANNNVISFDGIPIRTMNDRDTYDTVIRQPAVITSSGKISITQHMISQGEAHKTPPLETDSLSDPSTLWLMSLRDGIQETYFKAVANIPNNFPSAPVVYIPGYVGNMITLISRAANTATVTVNGLNAAAQFRAFPANPGYQYAHIKMDTSTIYRIHSSERVIAYYHGAYLQASCAFPLGDMTAVDVSVPDTTSDTVYACVNDSVTLTADPAASYQWFNGAATQSIKVAGAGMYAVLMRYNDQCNTSRVLQFRVLQRDYEPQEKTDTLRKCKDELLTLIADPADRYQWQDNSTGRSFLAAEWNKTYTVIETQQALCTQTKHGFTVLPRASYLTPLNLGPDTILCRKDHITFKGAGSTTRWSDGSTGSTFTINVPGRYWATVIDTCLGTIITDTVIVRDSLCHDRYCALTFPSAFTPDHDGKNDIFRPVSFGVFSNYTLMIYNRWGEKIFQSFDKNTGWNGYCKDKPADLGVYYYLCTYYCPANGSMTTKGELTLIR